MLEFHVGAMSCGHCVQAVTEAVKSVDPKAKVEVDLAARRVKVDSEKNRETLSAALVKAGYAPTVL